MRVAYYADLSDYEYLIPAIELNVQLTNVGWLAAGKEFNREKSPDALLDLVWDHCALSFNQTRGRHLCEFCAEDSRISERNGQLLLLGSAELWVLSSSGEIFAAPNLIYHYMAVHDYKPPKRFIDAVMTGPRPSSREYRDRLSALGLEPTPTFKPRPGWPTVRS